MATTSLAYSAHDIEVLQGLEPVRRRPGMYIGGTDERACHHLFVEILDNALDEVIAGHAHHVEVILHSDHSVSVRDDGRGIPVDTHPAYAPRSALEIIMTTLHAGGKFSGTAYARSGGLHGVGAAVVNALSETLTVEVSRNKKKWRQRFKRGDPLGTLEHCPTASKQRGTMVRFRPDPDIFGNNAQLSPHRLIEIIRSKAYLHRGVTISWHSQNQIDGIPDKKEFCYPHGLRDLATTMCAGHSMVCHTHFAGETETPAGRCEWVVAWSQNGFTDQTNTPDAVFRSYCNGIHTPQGGTHDAGAKSALLKSLRAYAHLAGVKPRPAIRTEDIIDSACILISVFIDDPQFAGQTKASLSGTDTRNLVETAMRDSFDHYLAARPTQADALIEWVRSRATERVRIRQAKDIARNTATRRLRLPGKLTDCSQTSADGTEIFIVEGDSAGGSAKQARNRETQAILPLRGKILNVVSAGDDKLLANRELTDLVQALGCGLGPTFDLDRLRYEKVIIMTDADVDGAHIASLLMTFFYRQMRELVAAGRLYLALPPLYRLHNGKLSTYARDDAHKNSLLATKPFRGKKIAVSRFKGLGEMMPAHLRETTMDPTSRTLARISLDHDHRKQDHLVNTLMGKNPARRYAYICKNARFANTIDV